MDSSNCELVLKQVQTLAAKFIFSCRTESAAALVTAFGHRNHSGSSQFFESLTLYIVVP